MIERSVVAAAPAEADSRESWRVLAGCSIVAMFGVTAMYGSTFGLMMLPMQRELGWSRGDIAFSLTLMTLVGPAILPVVGWAIDHLPLRPLVIGGVVLQSASLAGFGAMRGGVWVYYALCVVMIFTATGASFLTLSKILQGWFDRAFGRALGILYAVITVGAVIHPQIASFVIGHAGWRGAFSTMGLLSLAIGGLAAWSLVHERPAAKPTLPSGPARARPTARGEDRAPASMRDFLADRIWWTLAVWNMLFGFAATGITVHFAPMMQDRGLSMAEAATALSIIGVGGFAGNLLAGWLVDRTSATRLARAFVLAPTVAAGMLLLGPGIAIAIVAAVLLGVFSGGDHSLSAFLARRYFPAESFGRASATQQIATAFGSGTSPWLMGLAHDRSGSYDGAIIVCLAAFVLAAAAAWLLPETRRLPRVEADGAAPARA